VKVNPSALGLVSWKAKSVEKDPTTTRVEKKALPASLDPPSVSRRRVPEMAALPLSCNPVEVNPDP